jgi:hypothetical protein
MRPKKSAPRSVLNVIDSRHYECPAFTETYITKPSNWKSFGPDIVGASSFLIPPVLACRFTRIGRKAGV